MKVKYIHDTVVHNTSAATEIIPFLLNIVQPTSVIDVGCGTGTWLKFFIDNGIKDIVGIEGYHLNKSSLLVDETLVELHDLEKPFSLNRKYDLLISLEVAEHLHKRAAKQFVNSLTNLSDVIFFSAAIPHQGGQNHINEQPCSYWINLFSENGFKVFDIVRPTFWNNTKVEYWYKQNSFLFINKNVEERFILKSYPSFLESELVHPELFNKKAKYLQNIISGKIKFVEALKIVVKSLTTNNDYNT